MLSSANRRALSASPSSFAAESSRASRLPRVRKVGLRPELHRVGLRRRPGGALRAAERLGLVVVASVERARQGRRRAGPELVGALQDPWLGARVFREDRRRRRHPDAGGGERPIGVGDIGAVAGAVGLHRGGDLLAERDAFALRRAVGDGLARGRISLVDDGFLVGIELDQDLASRRRGRGLGRGARGDRKVREVARIAALHRVDCVGHRDMHHGQGARRRIAADVGGLHHRDRGLVPVGDDVGLRGAGGCGDGIPSAAAKRFMTLSLMREVAKRRSAASRPERPVAENVHRQSTPHLRSRRGNPPSASSLGASLPFKPEASNGGWNVPLSMLPANSLR